MGTEILVLIAVCSCVFIFMLINSVSQESFQCHLAWSDLHSSHDLLCLQSKTEHACCQQGRAVASACANCCPMPRIVWRCQGSLKEIVVELIMFQCMSTASSIHGDPGYKLLFSNYFKSTDL